MSISQNYLLVVQDEGQESIKNEAGIPEKQYAKPTKTAKCLRKYCSQCTLKMIQYTQNLLRRRKMKRIALILISTFTVKL